MLKEIQGMTDMDYSLGTKCFSKYFGIMWDCFFPG